MWDGTSSKNHGTYPNPQRDVVARARQGVPSKNFKASSPFPWFHYNTFCRSYRILPISSVSLQSTPLSFYLIIPFRSHHRQGRWTVQGDRGWDLVRRGCTTSASTPITSSTAHPTATGGSSRLAFNTFNPPPINFLRFR